MVNLYDHVTPLSSPLNIQTKGRDVQSSLPYLIFKTSEHSPCLSSPSPLTLYYPLPPNFQTHH